MRRVALGQVRDGERLRLLPAGAVPDHVHVGGLQVARVALGIEQRRREPVVLEPVAQRTERRGVARKAKRERLVVGERMRDELRQADGVEQAAGHAARRRSPRRR